MKKARMKILCCAVLVLFAASAHAHHTDVGLLRPDYYAAQNQVNAVTWLETLTGTATGFLSGNWDITSHQGFKVLSATGGDGVHNVTGDVDVGGVPDLQGYGFSGASFTLSDPDKGTFTGEYRVVIEPSDMAYGRLWGVGPGRKAFEGAITVDDTAPGGVMKARLSLVQYDGKQIPEQIVDLDGTRPEQEFAFHDDVNLQISYKQTGTGVAMGPYATGAVWTDGNPGLTSMWVLDPLQYIEAMNGASWGPLRTATHLGDGYLWMKQTHPGTGGVGDGMLTFQDQYAPEATITGLYIPGANNAGPDGGAASRDIFTALVRHQYTPYPLVPEPGAMGLMLLGLPALLRRQRR